MVSNVSAENLPTGWTVQFNVLRTGRKIKHYVNTGTGQKLFSKDEVMRHIRMHGTKFDQPQTTYRPIRRHPKNELMRLANSTHKYPEWLPHGWIMELKTRNSGLRSGEVYKCYRDPSTGFRFYSKPEVLCYLKTVKQKGCTSKKERSDSLHTTSKVTIEKSMAEDLPPGWIKEVRVRQDTKRIRRDPYYTDPVHGYVFRSKRAVQCYLKAGGVNRKVPLTKKRHVNGKTLQVPAAKRQKLNHPDSNQLLVQEELTDAGNQSSGAANVAFAETAALGKRRGERVSAEATLFVPNRAGLLPENCPQDGMFNKDAGSEENSFATPEADMPKQKSLGSGMERGNKIESQSGPSKSSNKNGLNLPRRSSKRLAGLEPEMVASSVSSAQAETMFTRSPISQISVEKCQKKHMIDGGTESKDKSNTNSSTLLNANVSQRDQGKKVCSSNGPLSGRETQNVSGQSNIKKGLNLPLRSSKPLAGLDPELVANSESTTRAETMVPLAPISLVAIEKCQKYHIIDNSTESKDKSNTSCSALLNANVSETDQGKKVCSSKGPVLTHKVDIMQEHNSLYSGTERSRKNISCKSNIKKGHSLPCRSSKRLAGLEPELVANSESTLQALQNATRSCKSEAILEVGLTSDVLATDVSLQLEAEPTRAISNCASGSNNPLHRELSIKSQKAFHDHATLKEMEIDKADDEKAEPQLIPPSKEFLSDPCLEFAFKTLTGAIAVENAADNGLLPTSHGDIMKKSPPANKIDKRSNKQTLINCSKSKTQKELSLLNSSSKQFSGLQLEPQASSISNKFVSQIGVRMFGKSEAILDSVIGPESLAVRVSCHLNGGHEAEHAHYGSAVLNTTSQKEPSSKGKEPIEHAVLKEESQKLEIRNMNSGKAEQQPTFSFADYWSDPCLEFAFKTLTGAIPVEDCLPMQGYFQQRVDASQTQKEDYRLQNIDTSQTFKDGSLALPYFGLPSFFQADISAQFDDQEKQPASQPHFPLNSPPVLPSSNMNITSRGSICFQQPHLEGNKGSSGKVTPGVKVPLRTGSIQTINKNA